MIEILLVVVIGLLISLIQSFKSFKLPKLPQASNYTAQLGNYPGNRNSGFVKSTVDYLRQDPFKKVGIVHSTDPEEDSVYNLYARKYFRDDSRFQYKVVTEGITIHINESEPIEELRSGDTIIIPSKESVGDFTVVIEDTYYI